MEAGLISLPDYFKLSQGTAIIWGESGATGGLGSVTNTLSLDALASGSARMGAKADLGSAWDQDYIAILAGESGTAPTANRNIDGYLAFSHDNTNFPGGVSGSDGAWPADGNEDEWALQLGPPVVTLVSTNDGNALQIQEPVIFRPQARYVAPVVDNNWDQSLRDEATASNNDSRFIIIPLQSLVQDTA